MSTFRRLLSIADPTAPPAQVVVDLQSDAVVVDTTVENSQSDLNCGWLKRLPSSNESNQSDLEINDVDIKKVPLSALIWAKCYSFKVCGYLN